MNKPIISPDDRIIPRDDAAAFFYRVRRYLGNATENELDTRLHDIAANLFTFTKDAQVGYAEDLRRNLWAERLVHLAVEAEVRRRDILQGYRIGDFTFRKENIEKFQAQPHILTKVIPSNIYCRYGERQWIEALQKCGSIYIRPASFYAGEGLDNARRDDELTFTTYICPHDYDLDFIDPFFREIFPDRCWAIAQQQKPCDHYLYCLSVGFNIRMFADFRADACLIIKDQHEFVKRLAFGVQKTFPGWRIDFGPAMYMDPYSIVQRLPNNDTEIFFVKHFGYMYQGEHRLVVLPPHKFDEPLQAKEIEIGSIEDISDLVCLNGSPFSAS